MATHGFIFIGKSGCGKGTQRELLEQVLRTRNPDVRILTIETGARFRSFIEGDSLTARLSKEAYEHGIRQPDFLACHMWTQELIDHYEEGMYVMFDGTPRSVPEAGVLLTALPFFHIESPTVIHIDVSDEWARDRLRARGRQDDISEEQITKRLAWFARDVEPALQYLRNSGIRVYSVHGERSIEEVAQDIQEHVISTHLHD